MGFGGGRVQGVLCIIVGRIIGCGSVYGGCINLSGKIGRSVRV